MIRFSRVEMDAVEGAAAAAGVAVAAWIGQTAVEAAGAGQSGGLVDLLRLHADVLTVTDCATDQRRCAALLARLESAIDEVITDIRSSNS